MKTWKQITLPVIIGLLLPQLCWSQTTAQQMNGLQPILEQLYNEMIPLCSKLISVAQGIAGFAALFYIAARVWRHMATAEPIDFYPLLRPFALGFCIALFPSVLDVVNGVLKPTVTATSSMVKGSNQSIALLLRQKEAAIKQTNTWQMYVGQSGNGDRDRWYKYTHEGSDPSTEGTLESLGNDIKFAMAKASYSFRNSIKEWMSQVLELIFEAAALCLNTLRTFQLIVLAILGPLVFGIAVFDGFTHTLTVWLARYINIYLWLPVANIFGSIIGKIQEQMLKLDINQIHIGGDTFFSPTDTAYLIFLIIGIVGYFTVPSVASYIVHAGGGNALVQKVTTLFGHSSRGVVNTAASGVGMVRDAMGGSSSQMSQSMESHHSASPYFKDKPEPSSNYMEGKLKGNA
ncbi:conjugative transposon protein TraJ [Xanthocytophaga agilis]|uniref:Conjugative transposon protein TraJ n=1 Tax=Xanthocytophaga agilis TaxID=3048010 RepID=A0AAE3UID6_9BACT|nr:conjugative transposon protein TraJ [Xanthocytophaga agilis]MDJ1503583.1 conjugative transposon protein TraJ [Xanthocytophaga agilis]